MGTIMYVSELPSRMGGERQIWVSWDSGSNLAMTEGKDSYEILEEEDKEDNNNKMKTLSISHCND
jgi:hypothetical protein